MQSVSKSVSDYLFDIKDKITDKEYIDMMNLLKKLNTSEEQHQQNQKNYKLTICFPSIELEHERCEHHSHYVGSNYTNIVEIKSIITKIIKCKHIENFEREKWCNNCLRNDTDTCIRIIPLTSSLKITSLDRSEQKYFTVHTLKNACDHSHNVLSFFDVLQENITEKNILYCFKKQKTSRCHHNDDEDEDEDEDEKPSYDIDYHTMNVDTRIRILSLEEIKMN
jgi:hypothetical protein